MEFHPLANIFPIMIGNEYQELRDSIANIGLQEPIITYEEKILDGRNRYIACLDLKIEPLYEEWRQNGISPLEFIIVKNLKRRNLNETQRGLIAEEISNIPHGGDRKSENQEVTRALDISQEEASKKMNVSEATLKRVRYVKKEKPELLPRLKSGEITAGQAVKEIKKEKRTAYLEVQRKEIQENNYQPPAGLFDVIVIDPPWPYGTKYDPNGRRAANPYPEMSLEEIAAINLQMADDCIIWLWTTHKFMRHSFAILDSWGFRDVAILTWVKDRMGLGSWLRSQSEFCIMAVKGKPKVNLTNQTTIINGTMREHSRKPDEFYKMVNELCPGYKIDWFSREKREGWAQFGNDTEKFA